MPHTASNWFALVLIGSLTAMFGLLLRRRNA
jgi:LPXTG-motif cell wall-anchored protein